MDRIEFVSCHCYTCVGAFVAVFGARLAGEVNILRTNLSVPSSHVWRHHYLVEA